MDFFDPTILGEYFSSNFLIGYKNTVLASIYALIGSFVLGVIVAVLCIAPVKLLNWIGAAYVEFIRNIPILILVYVFYAGLPALKINLDGFVSGTIGLAIYTSAFIAEAVRAGIQAVPKGQMEAARASGLSYMQTMRCIILPQAIKIVIPPLGNQFINLVKNSSVLGIVAGLDLMYNADLVISDSFDSFSTYIIVAVFYLTLTIPLSIFVNYLERRMARSN